MLSFALVLHSTSSPSLRGRGLKLKVPQFAQSQRRVALFARAWIEIAVRVLKIVCTGVALFARAWIEIKQLFDIVTRASSRPLCEGVD